MYPGGGCQANGTNAIILQTREQNEQHNYKRYRKQPILRNRVRPESSRPHRASRDDSWFLTQANDPWARRKNIEIKQQEDKESCFSATEENFPFIWRAINGYVSMDASISSSFRFSAGPNEPWPSLGTSSLLFLTVAQAFHGKRYRYTIPKLHQEKYYDISEGQSTPTPNSAFICPPSI